jgi:heme-degrading monooxygenase HmoA
MFARLARYQIPEQRIHEATEAFREAASQLASLEGLKGGYVLTDADTGDLVTITLWESRALMDASEARAARLRQEATKKADGDVASVQCFEVRVDIGGG